MRSKTENGTVLLKVIQAHGVKGIIRAEGVKVAISYKRAGVDVLDYAEAPKGIDAIYHKAKQFCALQGLQLWTY